MKAKAIIGTIFLIAFIVSLGYKLSNSMSDLEDSSMVLFFILVIGLIIFFGVRKVLRG